MHKKEFDALSPFLDDKGVIRVGGRVNNAVVTYESRHPALLPYEHRISLLITRHMHQCGQSRVATTTAKIRARYWILKASKLTKSVKFKYSFCREMAQRAETQQMADLHSLCLAPFMPPFHYAACDYFGRKTLRSDFHVLKYPSSSSSNGCGLFHYGIHASLKTILLHPWLSIGNDERQQVSGDRSCKRAVRNGTGS